MQKGAQATMFTVSQLTQSIKLQLEQAFPNIQLQGEISNFKRQSSGHLYFSLKDANAQIGAVMFARETASLAMAPKDGDNVIIEGEINVYPPTGKYQLIIRTMRLVGLGELLLKLEALKREIHRRGWFSKEHKKPLPKMPRRIGIVTSPTGAAIRDILHVLTRRFSGLHIILNPVKVQGDGAAEEIARAIDEFNQYELADVLIIGRGGGSIEDLWAFNEEIVAAAVYRSKIPIIAAIGHETDHCIAEYVADVRAPTPSAAAEIAIGEKSQLITHLELLQRRLTQALAHILRRKREGLRAMVRQPLFSSPYALLAAQLQRCDALREAIDLAIAQRLVRLRLTLEGRKRHLSALNPLVRLRQRRDSLVMLQKNCKAAILQTITRAHQRFPYARVERRLQQLWQTALSRRREKLAAISAALEAANPRNLLTRGYCMIFSEKNHLTITSAHQLLPADRVTLLLADGKAEAHINSVVLDDNKNR